MSNAYQISPLGICRIECGPAADSKDVGSLLEFSAWMATWSAWQRAGGRTTLDVLRSHGKATLGAPGQPPQTLEAATLLADLPDMAAAEATKRGWLNPVLA
jgi:hypothetical protein